MGLDNEHVFDKILKILTDYLDNLILTSGEPIDNKKFYNKKITEEIQRLFNGNLDESIDYADKIKIVEPLTNALIEIVIAQYELKIHLRKEPKP